MAKALGGMLIGMVGVIMFFAIANPEGTEQRFGPIVQRWSDSMFRFANADPQAATTIFGVAFWALVMWMVLRTFMGGGKKHD